MRVNSNMRLDFDVFLEHFRKDCDFALDHPEEPLYHLYVGRGHTVAAHYNKSDLELISRLHHANTGFVSSFLSEEHAREQINDAIYFCHEKIARWVRNEGFVPTENVHPDINGRLVIELDFEDPDEPVGYGFDQELRKYQTTAITVVLARDDTGVAPYGCFLVTAYPDLYKESTRSYTGTRYMIEDLVSDPKVAFENVCERIATLYQHYTAPVKVFYNPARGDYTPSVVARHYDGVKTVDVRITEKDSSAEVKSCGGKRKLNALELYAEYPVLAKLRAEMISDRDKLLSGKSIEVDRVKFHLRNMIENGER